MFVMSSAGMAGPEAELMKEPVPELIPTSMFASVEGKANRKLIPSVLRPL